MVHVRMSILLLSVVLDGFVEWSGLFLELLYLEAGFGCIKTGSYRLTFISYIIILNFNRKLAVFLKC